MKGVRDAGCLGAAGGGLHRHSSGPTSYRFHPSRRRILHHTCKCLSRLKAISQHLPPMSLQESEPRIHFFFFAFSALPFTGVGAVRVGVTGRSDISIQTQSRNDITQVGGLIGPPEG